MKAFHSYQNPSLAIDLVVFGYHENTLSVLLLNRNEEPFKNQWTLPGGFLQMEETFRNTCSRVLKTKLGIDDLFWSSSIHLMKGPSRAGYLCGLLCINQPSKV